MSTLSDRIRWLMQNYHLSQTELAEIAGVRQPSVANWLNGKTKNLKSGPAFSICQRLPVLQNWLVNGVGDPLLQEKKAVVSPKVEEQTETARIVVVKAYHIRCSAERNFFSFEHDDLLESKPYLESWIQQRRYKLDKLKVFKIHGNSMSPFLCEGDSVTVDTDQTDILNDKVYAFCYAGNYCVSRLRKKMNGDIQVIFDNPSWEHEIIFADEAKRLLIIGRVIHRSGTSGL